MDSLRRFVPAQLGYDKIIWLLALCGCIALAGRCEADAATAVSPAAEFRPDRLLIQPQPGVAAQTLANFHAAHSVAVIASFPQLKGLQVISTASGRTVEESIELYRKSGLVGYAEPDFVRHLDLAPNDPKFVDGTQWGLNNTGQNGGTADADINAPEGWDIATSAKDIVVAVLDTGVRRTHEDLAANIWTNAVLGGYGLNVVSNNLAPVDDEGHGSMVAGILGAKGNNGKGIAGIAWEVQIMACKCFDKSRYGTDSELIAGLEFARTNGARIINASFGAYAFSHSLSNAILTAAQAGIIFVAGSGNDGRNIDDMPYYPASYDIETIVSVGFSMRNDIIDPRSNYGARNVDLVAPGTAMWSTFWPADDSYLGSPSLYGSSFAAPHVSGTLALLWARHPSETAPQIIRRLLQGADPIPSLQGKCVTGGRLCLSRALRGPLELTASQSGPGTPLVLRLATSTNRTCIIEASLDFQAWTPIATNVTDAVTGQFEFTEPAPANGASRFYRAVAPH